MDVVQWGILKGVRRSSSYNKDVVWRSIFRGIRLDFKFNCFVATNLMVLYQKFNYSQQIKTVLAKVSSSVSYTIYIYVKLFVYNRSKNSIFFLWYIQFQLSSFVLEKSIRFNLLYAHFVLSFFPEYSSFIILCGFLFLFLERFIEYNVL